MSTILDVRDLRVSFWTNNGMVRAVRGIDFQLQEGETLAIVGESGSGKSVTAKAIMGILAPNASVEGGEIFFEGMDLLKVPEEMFHMIRGNNISMIFQDPLSSLNPIVKIGRQLTESMVANNNAKRKKAAKDYDLYIKDIEQALSASYEEQGLGANEAKQKARSKIHEFVGILEAGNKIKTDYTLALDGAEVLLGHLQESRVLAIGGTVQRLNVALKEVYRAVKRAGNPYIIDSDAAFNEHVKALQTDFAALKKEKEDNKELRQRLQERLETMISTMERALERETPDFLAFGYAAKHDPETLKTNPKVSSLNEIWQTKLEQDFLNEFHNDLALALELAANKSVVDKQKAVDALSESLGNLSGAFSHDEAAKEASKLNPLVKAGINRLNLQKDSIAYTFELALDHAVRSMRVFKVNENKKLKKKRKAYRRAGISETSDLDSMRENIRLLLLRNKESFERQITEVKEIEFNRQAVDFVLLMDELYARKNYKLRKDVARERAVRIMDEVGIPEPRRRFKQYPFEFSGGMRQRIVIAIALSSNPDILICDEPTTALDVTIQAQILDLIKNLKEKRKLSVIFITHDLGVVANVADRIAVMYAGKIIEKGTAEEVFYNPQHPYTWALLASMPDLETQEKLESIPGTPPDMIYPPEGDAFAARNQHAMKIDFERQPPLFKVSDTHIAATWLLHPNAPKLSPPRIVTDRIERMTGEAYGEVTLRTESDEEAEA